MTGEGRLARELVFLDARGGQARQPAAALGIDVAGALPERPGEAVEAIRIAWGVTVAYLGWPEGGQPEFELLSASPRASTRWLWSEWTPQPSWQDRLEWERPRWLLRATETIDRQLETLGRHRTGLPEQVRHTSLNALLRVPTGGGDIWYKAGPPMFAHESRTIARLHAVRPRALPVVLAAGDTWWLSEPFPCEQAPADPDPFAALADLQIAAASTSLALVHDGCPERTLPQLATDIARLANRPDLIDNAHAAVLGAHEQHIRILCEEAATFFPACVVHGDFHPLNRRWTAGGWFFYDWTDSLVSCPILDLSLAYRFEPAALLGGARAAYAARWKRELPDRMVDRAIDVSEALGAAHQAVNYARIADGLPGPPRGDVTTEIRAWIRRFDRAMRARGRRVSGERRLQRSGGKNACASRR